MADRIDTLRTELTTDPLSAGYAAMSDLAVATLLNDDTTGRTVQVPTLDSVQLYEAIDTAEFDALTAAQKVDIDRLYGLGVGIDITAGSKARAVLVNAFGPGSASRTAILAIVVKAVSRAEELGIGHVWEGHVQTARL